MYEVQVPDGTYPGQAFQASVGGTLMVSQPQPRDVAHKRMARKPAPPRARRNRRGP